MKKRRSGGNQALDTFVPKEVIPVGSHQCYWHTNGCDHITCNNLDSPHIICPEKP
jgi:hypothetical protein